MFDVLNPFKEGNGTTYWIMQSNEYKKEIMERLKKEIYKGYNPNEKINDIFYDMQITTADLTPFDLQSLKQEVEKIWREYEKNHWTF